MPRKKKPATKKVATKKVAAKEVAPASISPPKVETPKVETPKLSSVDKLKVLIKDKGTLVVLTPDGTYRKFEGPDNRKNRAKAIRACLQLTEGAELKFLNDEV